jgi:NAD(P)-dependent dehydrogenase (short-subunit alcohol dehydrogenase family)
MPNHTLNGKVVIVGAGAKNLGGLISREFAKDGAKVVVHYNSDATRPDAEATVQAVKERGSDAYATQGDLTKPANVTALFEQAKVRFGGIDIAVNTVGKVRFMGIFGEVGRAHGTLDIHTWKASGSIRRSGNRLPIPSLIPRRPRGRQACYPAMPLFDP